MPHGLLVLGIGMLLLGAVYTCMGESYERFYGWIYRSEQPKKFWWSVATYYLFGIVLIVVDVFDVPRDLIIGVLFIGVIVYLIFLLVRWIVRPKP